MLAGVSAPPECRDGPRIHWPAGFANVQARAGHADEAGQTFVAEPGPENMFGHRRPAGVAGADEHHFAAFLRHDNHSDRNGCAASHSCGRTRLTPGPDGRLAVPVAPLPWPGRAAYCWAGTSACIGASACTGASACAGTAVSRSSAVSMPARQTE